MRAEPKTVTLRRRLNCSRVLKARSISRRVCSMILASQRLRSACAMRVTVVSISRYSGRFGLPPGTARVESSSIFCASSAPLVWKCLER
ncbi:hypothetical protein D3C76_1328520 [compost metagenome]